MPAIVVESSSGSNTSTAEAEDGSPQGVVAQTGRVLGPRALKTRRRILDATAELLAERSVLDLPVVEIARRAGTSPATFYHYFKDVEEAALALAREAVQDIPPIVELLRGPWDDAAGLDRARWIVEAFIAHWDAHHAVLQLRNLAADRGDLRFLKVREETHGPYLGEVAARVREAQEAGTVSRAMHPYVVAAALGAVLERLAAYHREIEYFGASREDLVETCARILLQTIRGYAAD